jgi:hypothetical protein
MPFAVCFKIKAPTEPKEKFVKNLEQTAQEQPMPGRISERENNKVSERECLAARLRELSDNVVKGAGKIDLSEAPASQVLDWHWTATQVLEELRKEIFHWFFEVWPKFREDEELGRGALRILGNGVQLAEELMAKQLAAYTEIHKRVHKNETNFQFGQLLIAHQNGDLLGTRRSYDRLRRILLSIPYSRRWYSKDPKRWMGATDEAVAELCGKHAALSIREVFTRMMENGFAYVYKAVRDRLIDELRRMKREANEVQSFHVNFLETLPKHQPSPERDLQIESLARLVETTSPTLEPRNQAILKVFVRCLSDLGRVGEESEDELYASVVKEIAEARGVSLQQARADLRQFQKDQREEFVRFRKELRALVPEKPLKVTFEEVSGKGPGY